MKGCVRTIPELGEGGFFTSRIVEERGPGKYPQLSFVSTEDYTLAIRVGWKQTIFKD